MSYPEAVWERAMKVQEVIMKALIGELHWHRRPIFWGSRRGHCDAGERGTSSSAMTDNPTRRCRRVSGERDARRLCHRHRGVRNARQLMLRDPLATSGRASAIGRAHIVRQDDRRVWLFDGSAAADVSA